MAQFLCSKHCILSRCEWCSSVFDKSCKYVSFDLDLHSNDSGDNIFYGHCIEMVIEHHVILAVGHHPLRENQQQDLQKNGCEKNGGPQLGAIFYIIHSNYEQEHQIC